MDLKPFKLDIDELIDEFSRGESTTFAEFKRVWLRKKFSFIFEASPSTNEGLFMQSLYAHCIGYMVSAGSLASRLGGLYCLYCLYETQPFKPPYKIYLSLGELRLIKILAVDAKAINVKVVYALLQSMLEKNVFLFGFVGVNEGSATERVDELTDMQNARVQTAYKKLFADSRLEHFIHMDMGMELDVDVFKKKSSDYAVAKEIAIKEASQVVDVKNVEHIAKKKRLIGDVVETIAVDWNSQKGSLYDRTGLTRIPNVEENDSCNEQDGSVNKTRGEESCKDPGNGDVHMLDEPDNFGKELEEVLLFESFEYADDEEAAPMDSLQDDE